MLGGIYGVKHDLVAQIVGIEFDLSVEFRSKFLWAMDMQFSRTSQKPEGRNHPYQSETMVTMQVGNKHMAEFGKAHPALAELHLGTLCTIEHQHVLAHLHHLR